MFKKTALFAAALVGPASLLALGATASPAAAAETASADAIVYYTDLDLSTADGQETLEHRLIKAARKVCKMDQPAAGSLLPSASSRACYRDATQKVEGQIAAAAKDQGDYVRFGG